MFDQGKKGGEAVGKYLTPYLYASISIALLISLFSEEAIIILTPKPYHGAIEIVIILSMFYGSMFFGKQPQLIYARKTHITSALTLLGISLNVAVNIPLIKAYGAVGAAWGTLLAGLISGTISFVVQQRYYEIKWEYRKVGMIFLLFFGFSVAMVLFRSVAVGYEIRLAVKLIALACYLYLGVKLGVLSRRNFLLAKEIIPLSRFSKSLR
jgi:O-antigen/teichoic acid export membrane protein